MVILAGWFFLIRDWLASANWSSVRGTVRGVDVAAMQSTDPLRPWKQVEGFRAIIRYAYEVDEQTYVGERFRRRVTRSLPPKPTPTPFCSAFRFARR